MKNGKRHMAAAFAMMLTANIVDSEILIAYAIGTIKTLPYLQ